MCGLGCQQCHQLSVVDKVAKCKIGYYRGRGLLHSFFLEGQDMLSRSKAIGLLPYPSLPKQGLDVRPDEEGRARK